MTVSLQNIQAAGVVGAGGAGFPTHIKLASQADTVIINAAECEPLLHKDKELLRSHGQEVIEGLAIAMRLTGAGRGIIAIKEKYKDVIEAVGKLLGPHMEISAQQDVYPAGDEMVLVHAVLGRVVPPGGIPLAVGAVVMNVETACNVAASAAKPVTEKYLQVAGAVANPITLRVPLGVTLGQCVAAAGGVTTKDPAYVVGGVMMGFLQEDPNALVDKTTGGVIILPSDHILVRRRRRDWKSMVRIGRSACDQCSFCTEMCPRYLLGHPIEPHRGMRSLGFNLTGEADVMGASFCCECNLCSLYACPEDLDPRSVSGQIKRRLAQEGKKWANAPFRPARADTIFQYRKAPMRRLMTKLDLMKFHNVGPLRSEVLPAQRVGIRLKQHAGAPCEPSVSVGQKVTVGQVVGKVPSGEGGRPALGAPVHASIAGKVTAVRDGVVWIEKD